MIGGDAIHCFDLDRLNHVIDRYSHIVAPLRDPKAVWQSYCTRFGTGHQVKHGMDECFRDLLYWHNRIKPFYCPVDLGDRSKELSEYLGREIEWSDIPVWHIKPSNYIEKELEWFYNLEFVKKFYA